jgi:NADPH:quinone reductase-like Zn-dependent oxidoreductase
MEAFALDGFGQAGSIREVPEPEPAPGQVRIRVEAAGLNPFDAAVVAGHVKMDHRFPLIPGMDASGTVDRVGDGAEGFAVGDEVFGSVGKPSLGEGTLARSVTMSTSTIAKKPAAVHHDVASSIPVAGVTALTMADALSIEKGHVVVVIGATGGVGGFLVQLATARGAHVVAVSSGENAAYARALGAAAVVDYAAGDVAETIRARFSDGIDAIADLHGDRDQIAKLAEQVRGGGHVVSAVGSADPDALKSRGVDGQNISGRVKTAALETLIGMVERDELITPPIHPFPLAEAGRALELVGSHHVRGKVVVEIGSTGNGAASAPTRAGSNVPNAGRDTDEGRTE